MREMCRGTEGQDVRTEAYEIDGYYQSQEEEDEISGRKMIERIKQWGLKHYISA